jgi:hypothetical protein
MRAWCCSTLDQVFLRRPPCLAFLDSTRAHLTKRLTSLKQIKHFSAFLPSCHLTSERKAKFNTQISTDCPPWERYTALPDKVDHSSRQRIMSIWGLGNSVVIQHHPINIERRRVCYNASMKITERSVAILFKTNSAPMMQTPGEDSLSIFQFGRARLTLFAQTKCFIKYREGPPSSSSRAKL